MRQLHGACETLVALCVVILQTDLKFYGLQELAWLTCLSLRRFTRFGSF